MPDTPERLGVLENRMLRVEEGVANFREFQGRASSFFDRADERAESEEKQRNKRDQEIKDALAAHNDRVNRRLGFATVVIIALTLLVAWLTFRDSQRKVGEVGAPVVQSQSNQTQDAGGPTGVR